PFRMLARLLPHLVDGEDELVVHRLLDPQGAVVVERGEAVLGLDVIRSTLFGDARHIIEDRLLRRAVVPGRQRIFRRVTVRRDAERQHQSCAGNVLHPLRNHAGSYWGRASVAFLVISFPGLVGGCCRRPGWLRSLNSYQSLWATESG